MSSRCQSRKGFLLVAEAAAALVVLAYLSQLLLLQPVADFTDELAFQLAQDAAQTCLAARDFTLRCFDVLKKASPRLDYCLNCNREASIVRPEFNLSVWVERD